MSVAKVSLVAVELSEQLDESGFWHVAASVGDRLGARRIDASVYRAEAGRPIWPYHYHHGEEEWLYVIAGAPVLREPAGSRTLTAGDLVCFPTGRLGSHTVSGPGRFAIFATGQHGGPWVSVYPDSDKVSGPEGILLRGSAVGYWHGEGTAGPRAPEEIAHDAERPSPRPVVNLSTLRGAAELGERLGADRLAGTLAELEPGEGCGPYRYVHGRETWLLVLSGTPTLRHPGGEEQLDPADLVCFPDGPAGARELLNRGVGVVRALWLSTTGLPFNVHFPETGRWRMHNE